MSTLVALIGLFSFAAAPICLIVFAVQAIRKKPKKKWGIASLVFFVLFIVMMLVPICEHEWTEATCDTPKTCTLCEKTEGEPVGHNWIEATCEKTEVCSFCGVEQGTVLGHEWVQASCAKAKHCTRCELTEGDPLEHSWVEATCSEPKTCSACSTIEGEALGHDYSEMEMVKKASCTETGYAEGVCAACGETTGQEIAMKEHKMGKAAVTLKATCTAEGLKEQTCANCDYNVQETIPMVEHKMGKWTTALKAKCEEDGLKEQKCKNCDYTTTEVIPMTGHGETKWVVTIEAEEGIPGEKSNICKTCEKVLETETYELTAEEVKENYKKTCDTYKYKEIARNPGDYVGKRAKFTGKVIQVQQQTSWLSDDISYVLRVNVTKGSYGFYDDTVYVTYEPSADESKILEDDLITMYGEFQGEKTYTTIFGASVTIPEFKAKYIDVK